MSNTRAQSEDQACEAFVAWLDKQVTAAGRGDGLDRIDVAPSGTFWLGRIASEEEVRNGANDDRSERLDPCAIGLRVRPASEGPWSMTVTVRARAWIREPDDGSGSPRGWYRSDQIEEVISVLVGAEGGSFGRKQLEDALAAADASGASAEIRVDVEDWHPATELVVQLVNTSPHKTRTLTDSHLYETQIEVAGLTTKPFQLEALPDSFRYDRNVSAYGVNVGVETLGSGALRTADTMSVSTQRPDYWNSPHTRPDLSFATLADDPLPPLTALVDALAAYDQEHWSSSALDARQAEEGWTSMMRAEADRSASEVFAELDRVYLGLELLRTHPSILRAFRLMNKAIARSSEGRGYTEWRAFQVGFLLSTIRVLAEPDDEDQYVDTVWFATGGGKTETYLGLLLTAAFFDRLTGKITGVTAWSRFPLRLLSLQQTQRFADALAGAEMVRLEEGIKGAPFSLGFLVGQAGTPNKIVPTTDKGETTPDSDGMPDKYRVLLHCPFCHGEKLRMQFNRELWKLEHICTNSDCPKYERALPMYVVDQEVFRFLPTVVIGTLDKAASISLQQAMRGLVGPPHKMCSKKWHGYAYAERSVTPNGCLVPGCQAESLRMLPMDPKRFGPSLRLQDELHLLRDSLGAVDSHYERLLDHLQHELCGTRAKIVASSATLTGYDRQANILYQRHGRVFPQPGPRTGESFWTKLTSAPLRRYIAVAPRGVTLEHVSDRTLDTLQRCIRDLESHSEKVCQDAGVDLKHVDMLINRYGTNVVYGATLYDVEAAARSLGSNNTVEGINVDQLTGQTGFDDVRAILDRLENPEDDFSERLHVVAASSMLSHGVDVNRLNSMVMLGLPLTTAEFIQTTARIGRKYPGLVYVLHKIGRERDAQTFRQFEQYVWQGDRFVDPIPITRHSRRVLDLTIPGVVAARTLMIHEPASLQRLSTPVALRNFIRDAGMTPEIEAQVIARVLDLDGPEDVVHRDQILEWMNAWFIDLEDPTTKARFTSELGPRKPMMSLRDVEASAPIHD